MMASMAGLKPMSSSLSASSITRICCFEGGWGGGGGGQPGVSVNVGGWGRIVDRT
jgi:hypothetical protein